MAAPPEKEKKRFAVRRSTLLNSAGPKHSKKKEFNIDTSELNSYSSSFQEIQSARGAEDDGLDIIRNTFTRILSKRASKNLAAEQSSDDTSQFYFSIMHNIFQSLGLNVAQKSLMFSHLDSILSNKQHGMIQQGGPLSIMSSENLRNVARDITSMVAAQSKTHQVIRIQALVRCWIRRKCYKSALNSKQHDNALRSSDSPANKLSPIVNLKVRNEIFNELLKVEQTYILRLQSLVKDYLLPMRRKQMKGVDIGSIAQIFSNVEELITIHLSVLGDLEKLPGDLYNPFFAGIGDVFLKYSDEILPMYGNYIENYHVALDTLDSLCQNIPKFATFLEDQRSDAAKGSTTPDMMSCRDKLGLPLQHLPQWGTMLSQILQHSTPQTSNYESLSNCTTIIGKASDLIRLKLETSAANAKILSIQRRVESDAPLNLLDNNKRTLVREGQVAKAKEKKNAHLFLFNDLLLITEPGHSGSLKYLSRTEINQSTRLKDISKDKSKYIFSVSVGDSKGINIVLKTGPEKAAWMADIVTLIHLCQLKRVFGVSLRSVLDLEKREIPLIIEKGIEYVREHGMDVEGIFRIPGDTGSIQDIKSAFDNENGETIDLSKYSVHDVGGAVKLFFRELPNPLFPFAFFPKLLELHSGLESSHEEDMETFLDQLGKLIASLPEENRVLLRYLFNFLDDVSKLMEVNKMTPRNVAVVFAPNLIRPKEDTIETALLSPQVSKIVQVMIEHNAAGLWEAVDKYVANGEQFTGEKGCSTPKINLVSTDSKEIKRKKRDKIKGAIPIKKRSGKDSAHSPHPLKKQGSSSNGKLSANSLTSFTMDDMVAARSKQANGPLSARKASPRSPH